MKRIALALALAITFALSTSAQQNAPAMHHKEMGPPSTTLTVNTGIGQPLALTLADLKALPQQTITVHNVHSKADETYTGPLLSDVLAKTGLILSEKTEHPMLRQYLIATGTDKYWVVYSLAEVEPGLHTSKVIVALTKAGDPLTTSGQFQLVGNMDVKPARWVHNLTSLTVHTPSE